MPWKHLSNSFAPLPAVRLMGPLRLGGLLTSRKRHLLPATSYVRLFDLKRFGGIPRVASRYSISSCTLTRRMCWQKYRRDSRRRPQRARRSPPRWTRWRRTRPQRARQTIRWTRRTRWTRWQWTRRQRAPTRTTRQSRLRLRSTKQRLISSSARWTTVVTWACSLSSCRRSRRSNIWRRLLSTPAPLVTVRLPLACMHLSRKPLSIALDSSDLFHRSYVAKMYVRHSSWHALDGQCEPLSVSSCRSFKNLIVHTGGGP